MSKQQKLMDRMAFWCNEANLGYSQGEDRWNIWVGGSADCSSLVIRACQEVGLPVGNATYTGNMRHEFSNQGWGVMDPNGDPRPGDILLADGEHVAVYMGNGHLAEARLNEHEDIVGGQAGDQTGEETWVRSYYNYPWKCYLRWHADSTIPPSGNWNPMGYGAGYVSEVQKGLRTLSYNPLDADGVLAGDTFRAIERFQRNNGLAVDGIPGPTTKTKIIDQANEKLGGLSMSNVATILKVLDGMSKWITEDFRKVRGKIDTLWADAARREKTLAVVDARVKGILQLVTDGKSQTYKNTAIEKAYKQIEDASATVIRQGVGLAEVYKDMEELKAGVEKLNLAVDALTKGNQV